MKSNSPGLLFCTILFPNHISGLFSQGQDTSLLGTKQQSGVDGGYPAESAVRCDKLMANLTRRCCQAGRGGSCSTRDSLSLLRTLMWHGNLFQASLRQCLRALISPERWSMDGVGAETSCRWSPMDLSQQRGSAVNDCSQRWLSHHRRWKPISEKYHLWRQFLFPYDILLCVFEGKRAWLYMFRVLDFDLKYVFLGLTMWGFFPLLLAVLSLCSLTFIHLATVYRDKPLKQ